MSPARFVQWALAVASILVGPVALACEDEHPPLVTAPVEHFNLRSTAGEKLLTLAFDPRGVREASPLRDDPRLWIDGSDSTGAWHYREWQWWKGHPWGESCRPRYWCTVQFQVDHAERAATIAYRIDGFDCRQTFMIPRDADKDVPYWDIVTTIRNVSGECVEDYAQFFACYTPTNRRRSFWYWDGSGRLMKFSDRGVSHLDGYIAHPRAYYLQQGAIPHCPRGGGKIVGQWCRPVLVSHASPAGWRSIIMLEASHTAALAQGIEGEAMDYIVFPGPDKPTFPAGDEFSVHIRHVMLQSPELPDATRLEQLWNAFEQSHVTVHRQANRVTDIRN